MKAVNKASEIIQARNPENSTPVQETDNKEFFFVKADKKLVKCNFKDILYIEGLKDYVIIRLDNSRIITLQTMKSLEDRLPSQDFMRVHRSYIVNLTKINALVGNMIEITEKGAIKQIPIGKNYRDLLLDIINENKL